MPRILYRYLVLELLPPFGVSLLGFTSIVFLGRMMKVTQMIVVKGVGLIDVLKTCAFLLPYLLVSTLPMAATVGILLAMTRLTVDQEMIAMKTAGLSYAQLLPPFLGFSLVPTIAEAGYPNPKIIYDWRALGAPKGVPADRMKILTDGFKKCFDDPEFQKLANDLGLATVYMDAKALEKFLAEMEEYHRPALESVGLLKEK